MEEKIAKYLNQEKERKQEMKIEQKKPLSEKEKIDRTALEKSFETRELKSVVIKKTKEELKKTKLIDKDEEKIKSLLDIAQEKGLSFAISTAKKINDPYILDTFHDILIKDNIYKKFSK